MQDFAIIKDSKLVGLTTSEAVTDALPNKCRPCEIQNGLWKKLNRTVRHVIFNT